MANSRTRATSLPDERRSLDGTSTGALPLLFRHCHTIARLALRARRAITWASLRSSNYHAGATTLLLDHYPGSRLWLDPHGWRTDLDVDLRQLSGLSTRGSS